MPRQRRRLSRNVFRDLGFSIEEAENLRVRADLMVELDKAITRRGLTQREAARIMRVTQPRVSDLLRGQIDLFSIDTLIGMLARLGITVSVAFKPSKPPKRVA